MNEMILIPIAVFLISFAILIAYIDHYNAPRSRAVSTPEPSEIREFYIRCSRCMNELETIYEHTIRPGFLVALKCGDDCPTHSVSDKENSND